MWHKCWTKLDDFNLKTECIKSYQISFKLMPTFNAKLLIIMGIEL